MAQDEKYITVDQMDLGEQLNDEDLFYVLKGKEFDVRVKAATFKDYLKPTRFEEVSEAPAVEDMQPRVLYLVNSVQDIYQGYYLIINSDGTRKRGQIGGRSYTGGVGISVDSETAEITNTLAESGGDIGGDVNAQGNVEVQKNLTVNGNIYQRGESYETHAQQLYTKQDVIITRDGAESALAENEHTGIKAKNYDGEHDGLLVFDRDGIARVGDEGDTQPLATREEKPVNNGTAIWDETERRFKTKITEREISRAEYKTLEQAGKLESGVTYYVYDDNTGNTAINDAVISEQSTWSSSKVNNALEIYAKTSTTIQWVKTFGNLTLNEIQATYASQANIMYKGYLDWRDSRTPETSICEITCYDWQVTALTSVGTFYLLRDGVWVKQNNFANDHIFGDGNYTAMDCLPGDGSRTRLYIYKDSGRPGVQHFTPQGTLDWGHEVAIVSDLAVRPTFPNYASIISIPSTTWTATEDCYVSYFRWDTNDDSPLTINGVNVACYGTYQGTGNSFCGYVRAGSVLSCRYLNNQTYVKIFRLS